MLDTAVKRPYWTIFGVVWFFFALLSFHGFYFDWWLDAEVYINMAQTMHSGGVLYKEAIDTKNIGFFLSYYLMYYPYAMLANTKENFHIYHACFLTLLYFGIGALSYKIVSYLYDKKTSLLTSIVVLMFMLGNRHILFINQPQVAVFYLLCFLLYFYKTYNRQSKLDYFIYGVLLAILFTTSHIYAPLVLIAPFLSIQKNGIKNIKNILIECSIAGIGFFTIIGMIVLYLYKNDALADWWFWNVYYSQSTYLKQTDFTLFNRGMSVKNPILKFIVTLMLLFSFGAYIDVFHDYAVYIHYFIQASVLISTGIFIYKKYIKKQNLEISPMETALLFFSMLALCSRMLISRSGGASSYDLYLIPFLLINIPILFRVFPIFKDKFTKFVYVCFILCLIYIPYRYDGKLGKQSRYINQYEKKLVMLNPDKTPTVSGISTWHRLSLYSTKWKNIFYNVYDVREYDFRDIVQELNPEVLMMYSDIGSMDRDYNIQFHTYLEQNYTKVSDHIYIYSDKLSTWVLPESK